MPVQSHREADLGKLLERLENGDVQVLMVPDAKVKFYSITVESDKGTKEFFVTEQFKGENMDILDMLPRSPSKIISELGGRELYHSIIACDDFERAVLETEYAVSVCDGSERAALKSEHQKHFELRLGCLEEGIKVVPGDLKSVLNLANGLTKDGKFELLKTLLKPDLCLVRCHKCGTLGVDDSDDFRYCDCGKYFCYDCYEKFLDENLQCEECRSKEEDEEEDEGDVF